MNPAIAELPVSQKKAKTFQMRCEIAWLERIERAADSLGLSAAAYIRMVVTQRMNQDNIPVDDPKPPPRRKP